MLPMVFATACPVLAELRGTGSAHVVRSNTFPGTGRPPAPRLTATEADVQIYASVVPVALSSAGCC